MGIILIVIFDEVITEFCTNGSRCSFCSGSVVVLVEELIVDVSECIALANVVAPAPPYLAPN